MKISNKRKLPQILFNDSFDIRFVNFLTIYQKCTTEPYQPYPILVKDINLPSNNDICF